MRQGGNQAAQALEALRIIRLAEVDGAAEPGMHGGAAQFLVADRLADGGLHQGGSRQVEAAPLGHEQLVAQYRQVAATRHAIAHDGRKLRDARRGNHRIVTENPAEVVFVGENLVLERQEDARAVHQVDQRQPIVQRDALGTEDLLARKGEKRSGLDRGVVGDNHDAPPGNTADAGDDAGGRCPAPLLIHPPGCPEAQLEACCSGIEQLRDALTGRETPLLVLAGDCLAAASVHQSLLLMAEFFDELPHVGKEIKIESVVRSP